MPKANPLASMTAKLTATTLYSCAPDSAVYAELKAYASALLPLCPLLEELEREAFLATAVSFGLDLRERLCGGLRDFLPLADRRSRLRFRSAVTANDYTVPGIQNALLAVGIHASVCELPGQVVYVNVISTAGDRQLTQEELIAAASEFLPAHAEPSFDFRPLSWDFLDTAARTFAQMDQADLTWEQIDVFSNKST